MSISRLWSSLNLIINNSDVDCRSISQSNSLKQLAFNMKYFVIVLALVALVAAEELDRSNEPYYAVHMACVKQSGITPEQAEKMAVFDYPDEEQVHNYILCGASKVGVVDDPQMEKALEECVKNNASYSSHQVVAYHTFQCMLRSEVGETLKKGIQRIQTKPTNA